MQFLLCVVGIVPVLVLHKKSFYRKKKQIKEKNKKEILANRDSLRNSVLAGETNDLTERDKYVSHASGQIPSTLEPLS